MLFSSCDTIEEGEPVVDIAKESRLQMTGGGIRKRFAAINNGEAIFIIRETETQFVVYAAQCTHQGVELNLPKEGTMKCPNHGSRFRTTDGSVIDGSAYRPLRRFNAAFDREKNLITIS